MHVESVPVAPSRPRRTLHRRITRWRNGSARRTVPLPCTTIKNAPAMKLQSPAFAKGASIPYRFSRAGANHAPPLEFSEVPGVARSLVLIMDDPDAPRGTFTHWLAYDIRADGNVLHATEGKSLKNDFGRTGYGGPCPPPGHGPHRYYFTVYALDVPSLDLRGRSRADLEAALEGHTLAKAQLMGRYERSK